MATATAVAAAVVMGPARLLQWRPLMEELRASAQPAWLPLIPFLRSARDACSGAPSATSSKRASRRQRWAVPPQRAVRLLLLRLPLVRSPLPLVRTPRRSGLPSSPAAAWIAAAGLWSQLAWQAPA